MKTIIGIFGGLLNSSDESFKESMSIIGNLLDKNQFKLVLRGQDEIPLKIFAEAFYYSGGEVDSIKTYYQLISQRNKSHYFDYVCDTNDQVLSNMLKLCDVFILLPSTQSISNCLSQIFISNKPIYLFNHNKFFVSYEKLYTNDNIYVFSDPVKLANTLNKSGQKFE